MSQLLPLPLFHLLILGPLEAQPAPPESQGTSQTLPSRAGNTGALAGSSSISRASRNVLPGEPPCASSLILHS